MKQIKVSIFHCSVKPIDITDRIIIIGDPTYHISSRYTVNMPTD